MKNIGEKDRIREQQAIEIVGNAEKALQDLGKVEYYNKQFSDFDLNTADDLMKCYVILLSKYYSAHACKGEYFLDVGCGIAPTVFRMERMGYISTGLEPSQLLVDYASNELRPMLDQELYGDVNFFHGIEREALEIFGEKSFDVIFTKHVFEHLEEPVGALRRWKKLARKGICGIVPAEPKSETKSNGQHLFRYSEKVLKRLIEEQGYKNVGTCSFTASANVVADPNFTCTSIGYWAEV